MNELLGWYGYGKIESKDAHLLNLTRFTNHSPSMRREGSPTATDQHQRASEKQSSGRQNPRSPAPSDISIKHSLRNLLQSGSPSQPRRKLRSPTKFVNQNPSSGESRRAPNSPRLLNNSLSKRRSLTPSPDRSRNQSPMRVHSDHDQDADSSDSEQLRVSHLSESAGTVDSPNRLDQGSISSRGSTPRSGMNIYNI